ncbi:hypothetical protein [Arenibaculum pallidiluteum]|uniref:hypothetical protein n=1 Tax=Arenibaculum pallidiluteum TaxID=2812559 RepID=UPI001A976C93|nr:hypothetical protein [Arenibaculum pallidiluteum]
MPRKISTFEAGFAAAVAELIRMQHIGEPEARDVIEGAGYTVASLLAAGADTYDTDELMRCLGA